MSEMRGSPASHRNWAKIVAKAWSDETFLQQLRDDPKRTLEREGYEVDPDVVVRVVEETSEVLYVLIPEKPSELGGSVQEYETVVFENYPANTGQCDPAAAS